MAKPWMENRPAYSDGRRARGVKASGVDALKARCGPCPRRRRRRIMEPHHSSAVVGGRNRSFCRVLCALLCALAWCTPGMAVRYATAAALEDSQNADRLLVVDCLLPGQ